MMNFYVFVLLLCVLAKLFEFVSVLLVHQLFFLVSWLSQKSKSIVAKPILDTTPQPHSTVPNPQNPKGAVTKPMSDNTHQPHSTQKPKCAVVKPMLDSTSPQAHSTSPNPQNPKGAVAKPIPDNTPQPPTLNTKAPSFRGPTNKNKKIKHDVFVSFRGKDIRKDFLSHLIDAFDKKHIYAYVDDKLEKGDEIWPSLVRGIEESLISIVIFSENYVSSRWCLEELVKILECKEKYGRIIIPVFYDVHPTNVRHQSGSYEIAFDKHVEMYDSTKVQIWRHALSKSANIAGANSSDYRNDAKLLEAIVNLVLRRLSKDTVLSKGLVGIDKKVACVESLLQQKSKDVRVIGIWGMGGIGKTTIAEEVFNKLRYEYDGCCFLANEREESKRHGLIFLKAKIFSTLLAEDVMIDTPNGFSNDIERRIGRMKVLIVLDDVNDSDHLEKLFGNFDCFGSDSRIIVTTRDKQVLVNKVDDIYPVGVLESSEALKLFNLNAFHQSHLQMEYKDISKRVVDYADGIPLVLKVLGNLLRGKEKEVWESQLNKLKKMPIENVYNVMRLSYDDLDRREKKIFLDLGCFIHGLNLKVGYIKSLLKDGESDDSVIVGLERLKDKALITFSEDNVISMHDKIREMAYEIVRQESGEDPGRRSRLWDVDDINEVLEYDKGTRAIRSIQMHLLEIGNSKLKLSPYIFAKMSKLQFLDFYSKNDQDFFNLPKRLISFPSELRYLRWKCYPLKSLPDNFSAAKLVILDLSGSRVQKLWDGVQNLVNLKEVNLSYSKFLNELPNFSKAKNLEVLNIRSCSRLTNVHRSIFFLDKLEKLNLGLCTSLITLTTYTHLCCLSDLNVGGCKDIREFSVTSENMIKLNLGGTCIKALPSTFGCQSKLEILCLTRSCIERLPSCIKNLTRLRCLDVRLCSEIQTIPELPLSLETLRAEKCKLLKKMLFPSAASEQFKENRKKVGFWNCLNLGEHSVMTIGLNVQINVIKFAYEHLSAQKHDYVENYDDYHDNYHSYQAMYVYPGSRIPDWFVCEKIEDHVIIDLSSPPHSPLLGFIFCFIIEKDQLFGDTFVFNIIISDPGDEVEKGRVIMYMYRTLTIESDHVCVVYDQRCSGYLTSRAKNQTRFKIKVTAEAQLRRLGKERRQVALKGIGVSPVNTLVRNNLIQLMKLYDSIS